MRINFILPKVNLSGGIRVVAIYAKALALRGHQVKLTSPPPPSLPLRRKLKSLLKGNWWPENPKSCPGRRRRHRHLVGNGGVGECTQR